MRPGLCGTGSVTRWSLSAIALSPDPEPLPEGVGVAPGAVGAAVAARVALRALPDTVSGGPGAATAAAPARADPLVAPADDRYARWLADFERRLALREDAVAALATDIASRAAGRVFATGVAGFAAPPAGLGPAPDVLCERERRPPLCLEVALPETLVRRETLGRLRHLRAARGYDLRLVLVARASEHPRRMAEGRRLLGRVGLAVPLAAIAPDEDLLSGADW